MKYVMPCLCLLAAAFSLNWLSGADESAAKTKSSVAPETLLPASSVVLARFDGSDAHLEGLKETAAWKSLEESGLVPRILDLGQFFVSMAGDEAGKIARSAIEHVRSNGISLGVAVSGNGQEMSPYGVLVLHNAAQFMEVLQSEVVKAAEREGHPVAKTSLSGREISTVTTEIPGVEVSWWDESGHLVIATGMKASEQVLATATGKTPNVTTSELWKSLRNSSKWTVDSFMWINSGVLMDQFGSQPLPPTPSGEEMTVFDLAKQFGVHNIRQLTIQGGYKGEVTWSEMHVDASGPLEGLAALMQQRSMALSELPPLPKNTTGFMAFTFDTVKAWDTVIDVARSMIQKIEPNNEANLDMALGAIGQTLGGDIRDDFLSGFGDVWCAWADPAALPIPIGFSPAIAGSVKDKSLVLKAIEQITNLAEQQDRADEFTVRHTTKDGRDTFSIQIRDVPIVPTILVTDKWIVASITPGAIQSFVQRESGKGASWKPDEKVSAALAELPKEFTSLTVADPAPGYQQLMTYAPMALTLLQQQLPAMGRGEMELPFGVEDLPALESITDPMFPNVKVGFNTENGIASLSRQSVPTNPAGNVSTTAALPIMVALLLPAVQQAREAARRTQSKNNLKQQALALHNYHDVYSHFPRGTIENDDLKPEERLSWYVSILPFIEQAALYEAIDQKAGWAADANAQAVQTAIPSFQNPSQPNNRENPSSSDYVGVAGIGPDAAMLDKDDEKAGIFGYDRETSIRDITDGTSNTLMIIDAAKPNSTYMAGGEATIRGFSKKPYINGPDGIGSPHTGGVQAAFADGSVRFISENIDDEVLEALATMHGGETVGDF
ncbi:MAG: DUF1559 domain-containing protein [Planctomycetaceae bacterium]|nr:DUF1559 domain-containing protein [Planctomycetaceae bacterium]